VLSNILLRDCGVTNWLNIDIMSIMVGNSNSLFLRPTYKTA
jgi:hypothetical protein